MQNEKINVSVIIPVYNADKFLDKCLKSVIAQTLDDIEIIVINDGSTDKSQLIIEKYLKISDKIKVINKPNQGVTSARNIGIKSAKGEYIAFVDSDDYVSPNFLYTLYNLAKNTNSQIATCNYYRHNLETHNKYTYPIYMKSGVYGSEYALKVLINDNRMKYYIWNKIFSRDMIIKNNIDFNDFCFEDTEFCTKAFYYSNKVAVTERALYYYCKHKDSAVAQIGIDKINDYLIALASTRNFLEKEHQFYIYKNRYLTHSIRIYGSTLSLIIKAQGISRKSLLNINKARKAIKYYNSKKYRTIDNVINFNNILSE